VTGDGPGLTLGDCRGIAIGTLGMTLGNFLDCPVGVFWEAVEAHQREMEAGRRHTGELIRGAALRLFNLQLKRGDQIKDPRDFWPMPWDDEKEAGEAGERPEAGTGMRDPAELLRKIGWSTDTTDGTEQT